MDSSVEMVKFTESIVDRTGAVLGLAQRYRNDAELRARLDAGEVGECLSEIGLSVPAGMEARIVVNTPDTFFVVFPPDPNAALGDESLSGISAGGKCAGSAGSVGTVGTIGTATGCAGTVSTASSAASAGSAGS